MTVLLIILKIILAAAAAFVVVILVRAAAFRPEKQIRGEYPEITVDNEQAVSNLRQLIRCRTVSRHDRSQEDDGEFQKLLGLLPELYPHVMEHCTMQHLPDRAVLFRWAGKKGGEEGAQSAVLMAHYDVVPVVQEDWEEPAFEGIIKDGCLWGRGTLDTKVTFNGILTAADHLIADGFTPEEDIYFAFSGQEETNGMGARHIAEYFRDRKIKLSMVVDEGGAVVENIFPGVTKPCALIGIAEKGMADLTYSVTSNGGHASAPKPHTPVGILSEAVCRVEDHPQDMHLTEPVRLMFNRLGRESGFVWKIVFANLWCFQGILDRICRKSGGELNALIRTTVAFTQMKGSEAPNVIPPSASVISNVRINPAETMDSVIADLHKKIGNDAVKITKNGNYAINPSPISRTDTEGWKRVVHAVSGTWKGVIVSPYLMVQCSDSRHYYDVSDRVYKFSAMALSAEERKLIHGNNERIRLEAVGQAVEFFQRLMLQC